MLIEDGALDELEYEQVAQTAYDALFSEAQAQDANSQL